MKKKALYVYGEENNQYMEALLNGIEEQGIDYDILPLISLEKLDLKKSTFNMAVIISGREIEAKSIDFKGMVKFRVKASTKKIAKEFGLDIGRYIKRIPLKGDWYE